MNLGFSYRDIFGAAMETDKLDIYWCVRNIELMAVIPNVINITLMIKFNLFFLYFPQVNF